MARLITLIACALAALTAAPALAQDKPMPNACSSVSPDETGDAMASYPLVGGAGGQEAPDNFDIKQGFLSVVSAGGRNEVTANLQVVNLDKTKIAGWDGMGYWVFYMVGDTERFGIAATDGTDWTFYHGSQGDDGFLIEGETKGRALEGADGMVEIVLPGALNRTMATPRFLSVSMMLGKGDPVFGRQPLTYSAADTAQGGDDFIAKPCSGSVGSGGVPVPVTLSVQPPAKLKASKLKKGRKLTVAVSSSGEVKNVTATLAKGRKAMAKGKLASLSGAGKVSLKITRALKKGSYTLTVKGADAEGKAVSAATTIRVR